VVKAAIRKALYMEYFLHYRGLRDQSGKDQFLPQRIGKGIVKLHNIRTMEKVIWGNCPVKEIRPRNGE
jgi:hypothetical protein